MRKKRESPKARTFISDHEVDVLVPHLYSSVQALQKFFIDITGVCDIHVNDITFGSALLNVVHDKIIQDHFKNKIPSPEAIANQYFSATKSLVEREYLQPINAFLEKYKSHSDFETIKELSVFMNELNFLTSVILESRDKFLIYSLQTWVSKHNAATKNLVDLVPTEAMVIAMPFKVAGENIIVISEAIRGNIQTWHKEGLEARTHILSFRVAKYSIWANVTAIVTAIAISFLFLRIPNFEEKLGYQESILRLREENTKQRNEILRLKSLMAEKYLKTDTKVSN